VEPNYIGIISRSGGFLESYIMIYNFGAKENDFNISYTKNFITQISTAVTVPPDGFVRLPVLMNTDGFVSGKYSDFIIVKSGNYDEQVTIELELLESQETEEAKLPTEEQPAIIAQQPEQEIEPKNKKRSPLAVIIITLIGLAVMGIILYLQLNSKFKAKK